MLKNKIAPVSRHFGIKTANTKKYFGHLPHLASISKVSVTNASGGLLFFNAATVRVEDHQLGPKIVTNDATKCL